MISRTAMHALRLAVTGVALLAACDANRIIAPPREIIVGTLDGATWRGFASAVLVRRDDGPDSLFVSGFRGGDMISFSVEYAGSGVYALSPEQLSLSVVVDGDIVTGTYRTADALPGQLTITELEGPSDLLTASIEFDAEHVGGDAPYGPAFEFRNGEIRVTVRSILR